MKPKALLLFIGISLLPACMTNQAALTIYAAKTSVKAYHASRDYDADVAAVAADARAYLDQRSAGGDPGLAIVFDIDETLLSNYAYLSARSDFGYIPTLWNQWILQEAAPAIGPVMDLLNHARDRGVHVFIITGRPETQRAATEKNLAAAGCSGFDALQLKTPQYQDRTAAQYKTAIRSGIAAAGYTIIVNIGDQDSDLAGGYAEKTCKLPNRIYFIE